jgi:hypothetical protein
MPRIVNFEGKVHQFPDGTTDDEIASALSEPPQGGVSSSAPKLELSDLQKTGGIEAFSPQPLESDSPEVLGRAVQRSGARAIRAISQLPEQLGEGVQPLDLAAQAALAVVNPLTREARSTVSAEMSAFEQDRAPQSPEYQELQKRLKATEGFGNQVGELTKAIKENPRILAEMSAENIMALLVPAAGARTAFGVATEALPRTLAAGAAMGGMSAGVDRVLQSDEYVQQGIKDSTDAAQVEARLADSAGMEEVDRRADAHALGVGAVDALTGGVASRVLAPRALANSPVAREVVNAVAQTPVQVAGEGAGEAAGQMLADGKVDTADVLLEMAGGVTQGVTDPITAAVGGMREEQRTRVQEELDRLKSARESGAPAGTVEEAENRLADVLNGLNGGITNSYSPNELIELPPDRAATVARLDPLSPEEEEALNAPEPPPPPSPDKANDGTSSVNLDTAFNVDLQIGNTRKVRENAEGYEPNPNDTVPRSERRILIGPEGTVGQPIGAVRTEPATYVIGEPSDDRSADLLQGYAEVYEELRKQFAPGAKLIISNETMPTRQAIGMMQRLDSGEYLVVPAFARQFSAKQSDKLNAGNFNVNTKAKIFYNIFHEFGHVLTTERFLEGVAPEVGSAFMREAATGTLSQATIEQLPAAQQAIALEYNAFRERLKTMNAAQFQAEWMGPAQAVQRQLIKDLKLEPTVNALTFVRRLVTRGNPDYAQLQAEIAVAQTMEERREISGRITALEDALVNDYLSFDEFMAEQMARHAHERKLGRSSSLAQSDYFSGGINYVDREEQVREQGLRALWGDVERSLRKLFAALKRGIELANGQTFRIKAGTSFSEWVDSLSRVGQMIEPKDTVTEVVGEAKRKKRQKAADTRPKLKDSSPVTPETAAKIRRDITYGAFSPNEKQELYAMLRRNEVHSLHERMIQFLKRRVRKELDVTGPRPVGLSGLREDQAANPRVQAIALKEWKAKGTQSGFFKAWFGDWETSPGSASKVVTADGRPLVVYHATRGNFDTFGIGDVGFHFGTLNAAHSRMYLTAPNMVGDRIAMAEYRGKREAEGANILTSSELDWSIIPAFLNIRNPLELDETGAEWIWESPLSFADHLYEKGIIDDNARLRIQQQASLGLKDRQSLHQSFAPVREVLQELGFDGIKYVNSVEGGTSFVAFNPEQVKTANGTFSRSSKMHMQTDVDVTTDVGLQLDTLASTVEKYEGMGLTGRALRQLARTQWYVLQLQQLAHIHPEFNFLGSFNEAAQRYTAMKSALQAAGEQVAQKWRWLGKEMDARLNRALEAEVDEGVHWTELRNEGGQWRHVMTQQAVDKLKAKGIDVETPGGKKTALIYLQSKNVLLQQVTAAQLALAARLGQTIGDNKELELRLNEMRKAFQDIRNTPFLPRGDYGNWGVVIYEGLPNGGSKVVARYMFENESDLPKARAQLTKMLKPGQSIKTFHRPLADEHKVLLALPTEYVDVAADALEMTAEQRDMLYELLHPVKQDKLLKPYDRALEKIGGGSKDRMRNFADFVWHNSTMIARTQTMPMMTAAKQEATALAREVNQLQMDEGARQRLLSDIARGQLFLEKTMGYMLTPPNEWYTARSAVALTFLWGNVKTAVLNVVGLVISVSQLGSEYGDAAATAALTRAHAQLPKLLMGADIDEAVKGLYDRALQEGFLNQSYSAHLAAAATSNTMKRMFNRSRVSATIQQGGSLVAEAGMTPFTLAEQYTRRITFLAEVNAELSRARAAKSVNMESIYRKAIEKTDLTQNSYTLANRPRIMRGGGAGGALVPLATIFLSFLEHMSFHALGGYELGQRRQAKATGSAGPKSAIPHTARMLIFLLAMGGYEALPGAENLLDVLDWLFMKLYRKPARQMMRETLREAGLDPRWWATGVGGDIFGFNVSKSLGIGRIIPGTDSLNSNATTAAELAGNVVPSMFGVAGSLAMWGVQLMQDAWAGNDLTRNLTRMPGVVGNIANAVVWNEQGVRGSQSELIYQPSQKEVIGKALGFQPAGLSEKREMLWAQREAAQYWITQRQLLQRQYNHARDFDDREALADVEKRIEEFNADVVDPRMALRPVQLNQNYRQHLQKVRRLEEGIPERRVRTLSEEIEESFSAFESDEPLSLEDQ